jgi:hypothetical protein
MSADLPENYRQELNGLRAEVQRLRAELDGARQAPAGPAAARAGSTTLGSPVIAGQYNTAESATMLQGTTATITLGLLNQTPGASTPVGLYTLVRGIGMIVSAYGAVPFPATSKAVQAFCEQGVAVFADSRDSSGVYAHTTNGFSAVVADQGGTNPRGTAVVALGGSGIGVYASGETAAIQLGRSPTAGAPTTGSHEAGELVLDANAGLYLCKVSGTPGTWNQIG